jgi:hypothetical protein
MTPTTTNAVACRCWVLVFGVQLISPLLPPKPRDKMMKVVVIVIIDSSSKKCVCDSLKKSSFLRSIKY